MKCARPVPKSFGNDKRRNHQSERETRENTSSYEIEEIDYAIIFLEILTQNQN